MNRREVLGALGIASAHALALALGCGGSRRTIRTTRMEPGEIRAWLHDALATLRAAGFASAHALAVSQQRTTAAVDVLGQGVARTRREGVVLTVRDRDGAAREQVTSDVSADGVASAARALAAGARRAATTRFAPPQIWRDGDDPPSDDVLLDHIAPFAQGTSESSRIIYQAATLDLDDSHVWSVDERRDLEQRLVRIRLAATRVAWSGTRPMVGETEEAWLGNLDDRHLEETEVAAAARTALQLMTPSSFFEDGEYAIALEPGVGAALIDAAVHELLTSTAARRPEVTGRVALGAMLASPLITLLDDPTVTQAYGGRHFDDEGELAAPIVLVEHGAIVGRLADRAGVLAGVAPQAGRGQRAGHLARVAPRATHLQLAPGEHAHDELLADGFVLESVRAAAFDPASDRFVVTVDTAREVRGGSQTGRVFTDVELVGELAQLLLSVAAVSRETRTIGLRRDLDGNACWGSVEMPWLLAHGKLRARRSEA